MMVFMAGCYEVNEEITINDKGAGTYLTKMDMSTMMQMMQSMGADDELAKNGLDRPIDTTVFLKDVLDSAKDATPEQKKLFKDGSVKVKLNAKESILKTDINLPFKSLDDLQHLMSGEGAAGLAPVFKKMFASPGSDQAAAMDDKSLDQFNSLFNVTVTNGSIVRKLDDAKYKALMERPEMAQAKLMAGNGMEISYTTVIKLPRPVKKFDNNLIKLSDDKKTVTIKYDLMKLFDSPQLFSYSIYY